MSNLQCFLQLKYFKKWNIQKIKSQKISNLQHFLELYILSLGKLKIKKMQKMSILQCFLQLNFPKKFFFTIFLKTYQNLLLISLNFNFHTSAMLYKTKIYKFTRFFQTYRACCYLTFCDLSPLIVTKRPSVFFKTFWAFSHCSEQ